MESGGVKETTENDNQSGSLTPHFHFEDSVTKFHFWFTCFCCRKQSILKSWLIKTKRVFINLWCYASILSGCHEPRSLMCKYWGGAAGKSKMAAVCQWSSLTLGCQRKGCSGQVLAHPLILKVVTVAGWNSVSTLIDTHHCHALCSRPWERGRLTNCFHEWVQMFCKKVTFWGWRDG